ncbi:hypothetical protein FRC10_006333, partial [Ceratobasidium sp. 414]
MDDSYECVKDCDHAPFLTCKALSTHQRSCKKARAYEHYIATLSTVVADPAQDLEPPPKQIRTGPGPDNK